MQIPTKLSRALAGLATAAVAFATLGAADVALAREVVLKLATVAPGGSAWDKSLHEMAEAFDKVTEGKVKVKVYAGVVGDEPTILRKLRVGQLHGAALTSTGLAEIDTSPMALQVPMTFDTFRELDAVRDALEPRLDKALADKGYVVLSWGDAGWLHFFTERAAVTPADVKGHKMWMWGGDPSSSKVFTDLGFHLVVLSSVDIIPSLKTGMIDAWPGTAMAANAIQVDKQLHHMVSVKWAPVIGATVLTQAAWESVPETYRGTLRTICKAIGAKLRAKVRSQTADAIRVMKQGGLEVHDPDAATLAAWRQEAERAQKMVRGSFVDAKLLDEVLSLRDKARGKR